MELIMVAIKYLIVGAVSALCLVGISKFALEHLIRRDKGYYEDAEAREEQVMLIKAGMVKTAADEQDSANKEGK